MFEMCTFVLRGISTVSRRARRSCSNSAQRCWRSCCNHRFAPRCADSAEPRAPSTGEASHGRALGDRVNRTTLIAREVHRIRRDHEVVKHRGGAGTRRHVDMAPLRRNLRAQIHLSSCQLTERYRQNETMNQTKSDSDRHVRAGAQTLCWSSQQMASHVHDLTCFSAPSTSAHLFLRAVLSKEGRMGRHSARRPPLFRRLCH